MVISRLHPVHEQSRIAKFADDAALIIPSSMKHRLTIIIDEELRAVRLPSRAPCHALAWALRWRALSMVTEATIISRLLYPPPLDGAWRLLRTAIIWSHSWGNCDDTSSSRCRSGHLSQWRRRRTSVCFGQWWHLNPMCSVSFSLLLPKGRIICLLESILFFSLLRTIVLLLQEYYLNDRSNIYKLTWYHFK